LPKATNLLAAALQAAYWRKLLDDFSAQAKKMRELSAKVATNQ